MQNLVGISSGELVGKLHEGQPDTPGLNTLEMQQLFDALPVLLKDKLNAIVASQNSNNGLMLAKDNTTPYTPTLDYHPTTKKYVLDNITASGNVTPDQVSKWDASTQVSDRIYSGIDLSSKFSTEISGHSDVWDWIKSRIQTGNFEGIHVGDYIPFTANGNNLMAEVAGIDTYYSYGDVAVGHHIDFISRDCWPDTHQFNKADYNNGTSVSPHPWLASDLYAWLNSLAMSVPNAATSSPAMVSVDYSSSGVYDKLPAALKTVIVNKRALLPTRYTSGSLLNDDNSWEWVDVGKLWIPSEIEMYGCTHWSSRNGFAGGGFQQYPMFSTNMKRIRGVSGGASRCDWWLLSASSGNSSFFTSISAYGLANIGAASNTGTRVPVCFRIA